ncbi:alpha/beta fold hydrolase [Variovorax paradoxus]|uniref:alpha/beta fold hydrolase n=1 Tax=Variovorax paradoxus TaxID=34073 RepID=UPI003ECC26C8
MRTSEKVASHGRRSWLATLGALALLSACAHRGGGMMARRRELLREGDVQLDVIVEGTGPTLVLLPSSQRDSEDYDELAHLLATKGFKVLRPQPRGMGASRGQMQELSLDALAGDVALAVRRLGDGRAVIVGHAYGHFVARVADLRYPELVRGVVVLAAAARTFPPGVQPSLLVAANPTQPRDARLAALRHAFFAPGNDPTPWLEGWYPELSAAYRDAQTRPPKDQWWPVSHSTILDLQGADDPWRPPATRNELKVVLGDKVTVQVIPRASHAMVPEQPHAVAEAVARWAGALPL